jgi:GlpG protein
MPDALFRFALVWLIIGYTPLTEWVGLGRMANSAHLYGLLSGLVWAWLLFGLRSKTQHEG